MPTVSFGRREKFYPPEIVQELSGYIILLSNLYTIISNHKDTKDTRTKLTIDSNFETFVSLWFDSLLKIQKVGNKGIMSA
jgi:hypothetical protein